MKLLPFTRDDWMALSGAEEFTDGGEPTPLISEDVTDKSGRAWQLIADATGLNAYGWTFGEKRTEDDTCHFRSLMPLPRATCLAIAEALGDAPEPEDFERWGFTFEDLGGV